MTKESEELYERVLTNIKDRKDRVHKGLINSIPWGFPRFSNNIVGLEKKKMYQVTGGPKSGKSKITNNMFIYNAFEYIEEHNLPINLKVKYYCLEETKETLISQFMCYVLFVKSEGKVIVSPTELMSTENELAQEVIDELDKHKAFIQRFIDSVEYIENIHHPFGIYNDLVKYAELHGTQTKKKVEWKNEEVDDIYIPNDPEEIVLAVIDHVSLLQPRKGSSKSEAINELSNFLVTIRNKYEYSSVMVQQQALAQTSIEGIKFNKGEPTIANLGDSKLTSRDIDISFGIYSPFENKQEEYEGYNIKFYKDNIRFLTVLASRHGGAGTKTALYFNGAVNFFSELPRAESTAEEQKKRQIQKLRQNEQRNKTTT